MNEQLLKMKIELKELARQIKSLKPEHKQSQREVSKLLPKNENFWSIWRQKNKYPDVYKAFETQGSKLSALLRLRDDFRHKHIAYCMLRGRTLEQIENKSIIKPNMTKVNKIIKEFNDAMASA